MTASATTVRETSSADFDTIVQIQREAFGRKTEATLTAALLADATARPYVSLLAFREHEAVGHILFTRCRIEGAETAPDTHFILAPLAVVPKCQRQGIGSLLIEKGLELLHERGAKRVFVMGHKEYYPRHGFIPDAGKQGFPTPYPIPQPYADCWMVRTWQSADHNKIEGRVICADTLNRPEYWRE